MAELSPEMKEILRQLLRPGKVIKVKPAVLKTEQKTLQVKQTVLHVNQEQTKLQH